MIDVNKVILVGRLGRDPVRKTTKNGQQVTDFSVATTYRKMAKDQVREDGETTFVDQTQWHQVVAWGKLGDLCVERLKKGSPVYVEGSYRSHSYKDKNGVDRTWWEVQSEKISILDRKEGPTALAS